MTMMGRMPEPATVLNPSTGYIAKRCGRRSWLIEHRTSLCLLAPLMVIVGAAMAWNLQGYPGRANDDEGTYVDRAWAMLYAHHLSNYTYFWDHPFFGWATIAAWAGLTDGFHRNARTLMVGREVMWLATMASCMLLYFLARRLNMRPVFAAASVVLFGLSPADIWYHRMVSLDNLATMWALAAFLLATSRKRSLAAVISSALAFVLATWSKETIILLFPALFWLVWQHSSKTMRGRYMSVFLAMCGVALFYPLLAVIKGELFPGAGHVSLVGEEIYQFTRKSSGSLLDTHSGTFAQVHSWIMLDPWVLFGSVATLAFAFCIKRLRPVALALLMQLLWLIKGGYVPYAFVTAMLPFASLLIAGVTDSLWNRSTRGQSAHRKCTIGLTASTGPYVLRVPVAALGLLLAVVIVPQWARCLERQSKVNGFATQDAAVEWLARHVAKKDTVVCDAYPWLDIKLYTKGTPVYLWQIDSDPQVMRDLLPKGDASINYMVLDPKSPLTFAALPGRPTLDHALRHALVVQRFGTIDIYKVKK